MAALTIAIASRLAAVANADRLRVAFLALLALSVAGVANAEPRGRVTFIAPTCLGDVVDVAALRSMITVELGSTVDVISTGTASASSETVSVECSTDALQINLRRGAAVTRVPLGDIERGARPRVLALALAESLRASRPALPAPPEPRVATAPSTITETMPGPTKSDRRWSVASQLSGGVVVADGTHGVGGLGIELERIFERTELGAGFTVDVGPEKQFLIGCVEVSAGRRMFALGNLHVGPKLGALACGVSGSDSGVGAGIAPGIRGRFRIGARWHGVTTITTRILTDGNAVGSITMFGFGASRDL